MRGDGEGGLFALLERARAAMPGAFISKVYYRVMWVGLRIGNRGRSGDKWRRDLCWGFGKSIYDLESEMYFSNRFQSKKTICLHRL